MCFSQGLIEANSSVSVVFFSNPCPVAASLVVGSRYVLAGTYFPKEAILEIGKVSERFEGCASCNPRSLWKCYALGGYRGVRQVDELCHNVRSLLLCLCFKKRKHQMQTGITTGLLRVAQRESPGFAVRTHVRVLPSVLSLALFVFQTCVFLALRVLRRRFGRDRKECANEVFIFCV